MSGVPQGGYYVGIELGGTKCICTLASSPAEITDQATFPTESPDATLRHIAGKLDEWGTRFEFLSMGIASFGPICLDPDSDDYGHILATSKEGWESADVLGFLASGRQGLPIALDTDVNAAALAEMNWGLGRGLNDFAYVTIGTGVGVGLVLNGKVVTGRSHGELGHIRVHRSPGDDFRSVCAFHEDCVEGLASGPAIRARFDGALPARGDYQDSRWEGVVDTLGQLCHTLMCIASLERIILGGGVAMGNPGLVRRIDASLRQSINGYRAIPEGPAFLSLASLGQQAGPLGSIALARSVHRSLETTR